MGLDTTFFAGAAQPLLGDAGPVTVETSSLLIPNTLCLLAEPLVMPPSGDAPSAVQVTSATDIARKMRGAFEQISLSGQIIGREEVLAQTLLALLCREHQLLMSSPGTAKTLLSETICSRMGGVERFSIQMTRSTSEEELIGPLDLEEFKRSRYRHQTAGTMVTAHIAFIDEIFNASLSTLPVLNSLLNERKLRKGGHEQRCNLRTAIATTNFVNLDEQTEPVLDRFLMQAHVQEARTILEQTAILQAHQQHHGRVAPVPSEQRISLMEWDHASDVALGRCAGERVTVPRSLLFACAQIKQKIQALCPDRLERANKGLTPCTDRRAAKSVDCIRAHALLNGRTEVTTDDLQAMAYVFCIIGLNPTQEQNVRGIITSVSQEITKCAEDVERYLSLSDLIHTRVNDHLQGRSTEARWWQTLLNWLRITSAGEIQLHDIKKRLHESSSPSRSNLVTPLREAVIQQLDQAIGRIDSGHQVPW